MFAICYMVRASPGRILAGLHVHPPCHCGICQIRAVLAKGAGHRDGAGGDSNVSVSRMAQGPFDVARVNAVLLVLFTVAV